MTTLPLLKDGGKIAVITRPSTSSSNTYTMCAPLLISQYLPTTLSQETTRQTIPLEAYTALLPSFCPTLHYQEILPSSSLHRINCFSLQSVSMAILFLYQSQQIPLPLRIFYHSRILTGSQSRSLTSTRVSDLPQQRHISRFKPCPPHLSISPSPLRKHVAAGIA